MDHNNKKGHGQDGHKKHGHEGHNEKHGHQGGHQSHKDHNKGEWCASCNAKKSDCGCKK